MSIQSVQRLGAAAALAAGLGAAPAPADAAYRYTFAETGAFFGDATFSYLSPTLLAADGSFTPADCSITGGEPGSVCTLIELDGSPNRLDVGGDFLSLSYEHPGGGGTGFFFFQPGAFNAVGVYSTAGYPNPSCNGRDDDGDGQEDCYGSAAPATLTISEAIDAVPEPAAWATMLCGFGLTGLALRRRRATIVVPA